MSIFLKKKERTKDTSQRSMQNQREKRTITNNNEKKNENKVHTYKPKADSDCTTDESHIF